jgi:hypothetical protein
MVASCADGPDDSANWVSAKCAVFGELATSICSWVYGNPVGVAGGYIWVPITTKPGEFMTTRTCTWSGFWPIAYSKAGARQSVPMPTPGYGPPPTKGRWRKKRAAYASTSCLFWSPEPQKPKASRHSICFLKRCCFLPAAGVFELPMQRSA